MAEGGLSAIGADEPVVPASEYKALQQQIRELQRLLGKKTLENEILKEAIELSHSKKLLLQSPFPKGDGSK
jgi:transposase